MKIVLEIQDNKAQNLIEILRHLPFVKIQQIDDEKQMLIEDIKDAVQNLNKVKKGKIMPKPARELLDEL